MFGWLRLVWRKGLRTSALVMSKKNKWKKISEGGGFAAGGGLLGAAVSATIGNMGLAGAFGGIAIGATPVVAAGAVVGMAAYGVKKMMEE